MSPDQTVPLRCFAECTRGVRARKVPPSRRMTDGGVSLLVRGRRSWLSRTNVDETPACKPIGMAELPSGSAHRLRQEIRFEHAAHSGVAGRRGSVGNCRQQRVGQASAALAARAFAYPGPVQSSVTTFRGVSESWRWLSSCTARARVATVARTIRHRRPNPPALPECG
jgi:hypothetical protein